MLHYNECYHGTSVDVYETVRTTKRFTAKKRENHWLGQGIYFFIEDQEKAKWFVTASRRYKTKRKCVIQVRISLSKKDLLNLDIESDRNKLKLFVESFFKMNPLSKEKVVLKEGSQSCNARLRCFCLDLYNRYHQIKAVKYTFSDNKIEYRILNANETEADQIVNNSIQLNVVDQRIIDFESMIVEYIGERMN